MQEMRLYVGKASLTNKPVLEAPALPRVNQVREQPPRYVVFSSSSWTYLQHFSHPVALLLYFNLLSGLLEWTSSAMREHPNRLRWFVSKVFLAIKKAEPKNN